MMPTLWHEARLKEKRMVVANSDEKNASRFYISIL
jgi:hypothetical protein